MKLKTSLVFIFVFAIVVLILDILGCERIERVMQPTSQPASLSGEIAIGVVSSQTGVLGPGTFGPGGIGDGKRLEHGTSRDQRFRAAR